MWGVAVGKVGEGGQKVHTCSNMMNKSWECNVRRGDSS